MKRFLGRLTAVLAVIACVSMVSSNSAFAVGAGNATIAGSGTISPGLTDIGRNQTVSFSGTGAAAAVSAGPNAAYTGPVSCSFSASGINETTTSGGGTANGSCSGSVGPLSLSASCSLTYTRTGGVVVINGGCTITITGPVVGTATAGATVRGAFVFAPTSANPVTSYALVGDAILNS